MATLISKRAAVRCLMLLFVAADIAASLWQKNSCSSLSHAAWDICGVLLGYFILRSFFGRSSKLFPVIACVVAMSMRAAQCTGVVSDMIDGESILGKLLDRNAFAGDMLACMPAMVLLLLAMELDKYLKKEEIKIAKVLLAFICAFIAFLLSALLPGMILFWLVLMIIISKSENELGLAIKGTGYIFGMAFFAFASYAILEIRFAVQR